MLIWSMRPYTQKTDISDYIKHLLVRTPFEKPAVFVQDVLKLHRVVRHPGLFRLEVETAVVRAAIPRLVTDPVRTASTWALTLAAWSRC
jgi:hypothetical protein